MADRRCTFRKFNAGDGRQDGDSFSLSLEIAMTYSELQDVLSSLTKQQLDCDITLFDSNEGEFYPALLSFQEGDDVLDDNHPYFERK